MNELQWPNTVEQQYVGQCSLDPARIDSPSVGGTFDFCLSEEESSDLPRHTGLGPIEVSGWD